MTIHKTTHAASVFGDPEAFRPERWLADENAKNDVRTLDKAYVPFGRGSRMCPGQQYVSCFASEERGLTIKCTASHTPRCTWPSLR